MVDKVLLFRKLDSLATYRGQLAEYEGFDTERYRKDWKAQRIVERTLQMMIETCMDIANHIIADAAMRAPTSAADAFAVLRENDVVSEDLHAEFGKMVKFRNVVVHQYDDVDADIVIAILRKHLGTFDSFRTEIAAFLKK